MTRNGMPVRAVVSQPAPPDPDLSLPHLQAELARLDVRVQRAVRLWQTAGQDPTDAYRGLYLSDADAESLAGRPFGLNWGGTAALTPEDADTLEAAARQFEQSAAALAEQGQRTGRRPRLLQLADTFGLERPDLDLLLVVLAPALDLRYEKLYGYLQDDVTRKRPSVNLALDLLAEPGAGRLAWWPRFADDAPLFRHGLLERVPDTAKLPLLNHLLAPDPAVVAWLLGRYQPHIDLGGHAQLANAPAIPAAALLAAEAWPALEAALAAPEVPAPAEPALMVFHGPDQAAQTAAAQCVAAQVGRPLLMVDLAGLLKDGLTPARAVHLALRDARLTGAMPALFGWEALLVDGSLAPDLLTEICAFPGWAVMAGRTPWQAAGVERERRLLWAEFPLPAFRQRRSLWAHFLERDPAAETVTALAGQFALTTGQIRDACATARDLAAQRGEALGDAHLFAAARAHSNPNLAHLARKIVARYGWDDIILPTDQVNLLRELVATVRGRPVVLEQWGLGRKLASSAGVTALFAGPPGTGKTMAAEVIAAALGLDLYKIDLSTVVSKYIGETEKNLEKIFAEAQSSNAILFFDEADALFGKRSEVRDSHDRYANLEISYLLQRMEAYDGVTILATNLRANMDEAFKRRLHFVVDFPFPEEADRLRIWRALWPSELPRAGELDLGLMARRYKLAGGSIRNIIVSAAYLAAANGGRVTLDHLLHGTRRELQKLGRLMGEPEPPGRERTP